MMKAKRRRSRLVKSTRILEKHDGVELFICSSSLDRFLEGGLSGIKGEKDILTEHCERELLFVLF